MTRSTWPDDEYANPVIPGFHPDPSVCRVGDAFFLVVSSFEYFPAIPIFTSTDLVSWRQLGHVLDRAEQVDLSDAATSGGIYAPTIRHDGERFYVTATNVSQRGHFIVSARDPAGPWSQPVVVDQNGIDPSLHFEDGLTYFTSNVEPDPSGPHLAAPSFQRGIQQSIIDPTTGELIQGPRFIWSGTGGRFPEAPHLFRRGGYYFLVIAEGGTQYGHYATVARSSTPWGPFESSPYGALIDHRSIVSPLRAVGHADLVTLPNGDWWLVCLGVRPVGRWPRHLLGRETLLAPVHWTADDWPRVGSGSEVPARSQRPNLPTIPTTPKPSRDDFESSSLRHCWTSVRQPIDATDMLSPRRGWLRLQPKGRLMTSRTPCFLGRRQEQYRFDAATRISAELEDTEEAGICVWMDERHWYSLGIRRSGQQHQLVLHRRIGDLDLADVVQATVPHELTLLLGGDSANYTFGWHGSGGTVAGSVEAEALLLSAEVSDGFTGMFIGLYATGQRPQSAGAAYFDWFDYSDRPAGAIR